MPATRMNVRLLAAGIGVLIVAGVALAWLSGAFSPPDPLVVYCAHDEEFSAPILRKFTEQTGIPVEVRYDTEATKSLGLVNLLLQEREHPRCDVFWNNQVLTMMELQDEGLLVPYKGPGYERIPEQYKDADGHWTGFAARLRVCIVNTKNLSISSETDLTVLEVVLRFKWDYVGDDSKRRPNEHGYGLFDDNLSKMAIANPLYGTTLTHYAVLWHLWRAERLQAWHRNTRRRGLREVTGNAAVKNLVADGVCDFGWTDTDDFFVARDAGKPVAMFPVRTDTGGTICIPNSVAIIHGTKKLGAARRLMDFLLSKKTEHALAVSPSRQIPLGPIDEKTLPKEVRELLPAAKQGYDLRKLGQMHKECLAWLKAEYLQ